VRHLLLGFLLLFGATGDLAARPDSILPEETAGEVHAARPGIQDAPASHSIQGAGGSRDIEEPFMIRLLRGLLGLGFLVGMAVLFSAKRKSVSWSLIAKGMLLQLVFGILVLRTTWGRSFFRVVNDVIVALIGYANAGSSFVFGQLINREIPVTGGDGVVEVGANFAFSVLPTIIFFASLLAILYFLGVMQRVVKGVAWAMQRTLKTSGAETLSAAGNIFVGQTEAPLLIRPFVGRMTMSELNTVMTGGFATVAGGVMAAYVAMLSGYFPDIAGHLLAASIMAAPAGIVISKTLMPETDEPATKGTLAIDVEKTDANVIGDRPAWHRRSHPRADSRVDLRAGRLAHRRTLVRRAAHREPVRDQDGGQRVRRVQRACKDARGRRGALPEVGGHRHVRFDRIRQLRLDRDPDRRDRRHRSRATLGPLANRASRDAGWNRRHLDDRDSGRDSGVSASSASSMARPAVGQRVEEAVEALKDRLGVFEPVVGVILGSGLGGLAGRFEDAQGIAAPDLPHWPVSTVEGHEGEIIAGTLAGVPAVGLSGRVHMYEGHPPEDVAMPTRVLARLGIRALVVSNAAGGVRLDLEPGDLMLIADQINLMGRNPLFGPVPQGETRWPDMYGAYDPELKQVVRDVAREQRIRLKEGTYLALLGPNYETPAEIRALRKLGADAVGMSTVPEVIAARAFGVRCVGVSCITNLAAGISPEPLDHEEVLETGALVAEAFQSLILASIKEFGELLG
jgi:purine-nucleoside phosphorylase